MLDNLQSYLHPQWESRAENTMQVQEFRHLTDKETEDQGGKSLEEYTAEKGEWPSDFQTVLQRAP